MRGERQGEPSLLRKAHCRSEQQPMHAQRLCVARSTVTVEASKTSNQHMQPRMITDRWGHWRAESEENGGARNEVCSIAGGWPEQYHPPWLEQQLPVSLIRCAAVDFGKPNRTKQERTADRLPEAGPLPFTQIK